MPIATVIQDLMVPYSFQLVHSTNLSPYFFKIPLTNLHLFSILKQKLDLHSSILIHSTQICILGLCQFFQNSTGRRERSISNFFSCSESRRRYCVSWVQHSQYFLRIHLVGRLLGIFMSMGLMGMISSELDVMEEQIMLPHSKL